MINAIVDNIIGKLNQNNIKEVYGAFDAVAVEKKGESFYNIVGVEYCEMQKPVYSEFTVFVPYRADAFINITAPENYSMQKLYEYFSEKIKPAVMSFSGMDCFIKKISIKHDSNINRLVMNVKFSVAGMEKTERRIL